MKYSLNIAWLYPDLMSTYGDRGNVIVLQKRCLLRRIGAEIKSITLETPVGELEKCDLIFMGGAQDRQQQLLASDFLKNKAPVVKKMVNTGIPSLFVCAAYQAVGHYYRPFEGEDIRGASIFDLVTVHPGDQAKRFIGNAVSRLLYPEELKGRIIIGFENHGGRTALGKNIKPLARTVKGYGNNGRDGFEGAIYKNSIASYFHGPILPKNPVLSDWLISKALEFKYGKSIKLAPIDDRLAELARSAILTRLGVADEG